MVTAEHLINMVTLAWNTHTIVGLAFYEDQFRMVSNADSEPDVFGYCDTVTFHCRKTGKIITIAQG